MVFSPLPNLALPSLKPTCHPKAKARASAVAGEVEVLRAETQKEDSEASLAAAVGQSAGRIR